MPSLRVFFSGRFKMLAEMKMYESPSISERNSLKPKAKMAEPAKKEKKMMIPDWTKLPKELLQIVTDKMNCFEVVHARSVSTLWRSAFPFPASLLRSSYSLPTYPVEKEGLCSLEKIPVVLVVDESGSEFFMGLVGGDDSAYYMEAPSPLQCSLRVKLEKSDPTSMNVIGSQILSLGHQCRIVCWDPKGLRTTFRNAAILPLNGEGGRGEFAVLRSYLGTLLVLKSATRKWVPLPGVPRSSCNGLVTFRGRFYASFSDNTIYVIHPYSLRADRLMPPPNMNNGSNHLIPAGDDELFLVKKSKLATVPKTFIVSRLVGLGWVEVDDLGDRVLFLRKDANVCFSANQLPDGCGVTGNSILFNARPGDETYFYKYGPPDVPKENVVGEWRISKESRVKFIDSHEAYAFRVEF
uniref:Uncharacterized protein n=1 Tax=Brassica campestris TaxID=3711 RepID=A0A3P6A8K7_BRACM|nr:unnamed protein product [Brassica rapa]